MTSVTLETMADDAANRRVKVSYANLDHEARVLRAAAAIIESVRSPLMKAGIEYCRMCGEAAGSLEHGPQCTLAAYDSACTNDACESTHEHDSACEGEK